MHYLIGVIVDKDSPSPYADAEAALEPFDENKEVEHECEECEGLSKKEKAKCEYCDGTGINNRNPDGRWDWYAIGGRWEGYLSGKDITAAPNTIKVKNLLKKLRTKEIEHAPYAIITSEGEWIDKEDDKEIIKLLEEEDPENIVVGVDCHD